MTTWREDHDADARRPVRSHSDRSRRDDERPQRGRRKDGDEVKPGRDRRRPPHKGPRDSAFSDDRGGDRRKRRGGRRGEAGYDRRSGHDRLRDYPRRHDWRDPEDAPDDDELD